MKTIADQYLINIDGKIQNINKLSPTICKQGNVLQLK